MNAIYIISPPPYSPGTWLDCDQLKSIAGSAVSSSLEQQGFVIGQVRMRTIEISHLPALAVHQLPPNFLSDGVMVVDLN